MTPVTTFDRLIPGTQLIVRRLGYLHHGIYVGEERVVHYAGHISYAQGLVEEIRLAEFVCDRAAYVGYVPDSGLPGEEVVRRARSRLGERCYDLLENNCEHFCAWCHMREPRSAQVDALSQCQRAIARTAETLVLFIRLSIHGFVPEAIHVPRFTSLRRRAAARPPHA